MALRCNQLAGFGAGRRGGKILSVTPLTEYATSGAATTYLNTFSIGAAPSGGQRRYLVVTAQAAQSAARTCDSITIGGTTSGVSFVGQSNELGSAIGVGFKEVPSGTTSECGGTFSGSMACGGIMVYVVTTDAKGLALTDWAASLNDSWAASLVTTPNRFVLAGSENRSGGAHSFGGGLTEHFDGLQQSGITHAGASRLDLTGGGTSWSGTLSTAAGEHAWIAAAFGPGG